MLLPLILRPVSVSSRPPVFDAVSPYGYGGPFGGSADERVEFMRTLRRWAEHANVVSAFVRLALDAGLEPFLAVDEAAVRSASNVRVDLRQDEAQVWRSYEAKVRKNVNKALRHGCTVESADKRPDHFHGIYTSTMTRRGAADRYRFDEEFFDRLDASGCGVRYYSVFDGDGRPVSVEAVLSSDANLYSFLGGTLAEAFPLAPNDLLKHRIITDGLEAPQDWFVLGGGLVDGDGIFRYKRSFAPRGAVDFSTYRAIWARASFAAALHKSSAEVDWPHELTAPYFPSFRR